jgi:hypothetical protein
MIFLSRSWHRCVAMKDADATIATIAGRAKPAGEGFLER